MKLFKLGEKAYRAGAKTPSLSDLIFNTFTSEKFDYKLLLDLYDETWVLEQIEWLGDSILTTYNPAPIHVNRYSD